MVNTQTIELLKMMKSQKNWLKSRLLLKSLEDLRKKLTRSTQSEFQSIKNAHQLKNASIKFLLPSKTPPHQPQSYSTAKLVSAVLPPEWLLLP